jgi:RsmE family RNA methyltransferase
VRVNRFFCQVSVERDGVITVPDREMAGQISRVLRLPVGAPVELFDGTGRVVSARLAGVSRDDARFEKISESAEDDAARVARRIDLYPSVIKNDHLSLVVEKATELGASLVSPVVAARSVKRDANAARLARIAREAAEQCGRATVPEVSPVADLGDAVAAAAASSAAVVRAPRKIFPMRSPAPAASPSSSDQRVAGTSAIGKFSTRRTSRAPRSAGSCSGPRPPPSSPARSPRRFGKNKNAPVPGASLFVVWWSGEPPVGPPVRRPAPAVGAHLERAEARDRTGHRRNFPEHPLEFD